MTRIQIAGLTVEREGALVLGPLDLLVEDGERRVLLGPSGCGKTTLLRAVAGVQPVTEGTIVFGDHDVTHEAPRHRDVALIDQQASLQPHLDVRRNLGFALRLRRTPRDQVSSRVDAQSRVFTLRSLLPRRPTTLSGGERHEVALARSLMRRTSVLLMDEPMARIDPVRRSALVRELIRVQEGYGVTLLVATNDQRDAMSLAHRISVLQDGEVVQTDTPEALYRHPATTFVAGFLGTPPMNLLDGRITRVDGAPHVEAEPFTIRLHAPDLARRVGDPVTVGVRPEHLHLDTAAGPASTRCRVVRRVFAGATIQVDLRSPSGRRLVAVTERPGPDPDMTVAVTVERRHVHLFSPTTGLAFPHGP